MLLAEPKNPRTKRHPLWSLDTLKEELRRSSLTLTKILQQYSEDPSRWRALYADTVRWRQQDPELIDLIKQHTQKTDSKKRTEIKGGRPRKDEDPEHADWRVRYCEALLVTKSRVRAAESTPYPYETIYMMLNEKYASFDKDFAEMVHQTEMRLVAWAEEVMWTSLSEATAPKDKAWIAKEILKVRDRPRWGDKLDIGVAGNVVHQHVLDRGKILAELAAEQQTFMPAPKLAIAAHAEVLDVEPIPLDS